ncbi:hypothetical protein GGH96_004920 [Coemansia sp. RSA 1972]|nr:hypothetical protein GGH96_004920 [Coemansia sp. RSA 1972]
MGGGPVASIGPKRFRRQSLRTYPRGMGIMVVFSSFVALAMGPGLLNAYGVYEEEYDRLFDSKDESHAWSGAMGSPVIFIGVIQIFLANGMGFIGGHCAQRFGPGPSVFAGGILMALGLFAASYAREVWQLCLSQGVLFGLGVCLTWIPAASAPASWFEKNRGLATGITHMGLGIGGLVFAPLTRFLLEKAGTSGSLRWLALVMFVGVALASLGIHSKHHERPVSEIFVASVRWSTCLDNSGVDNPAIDNGYDSDADESYEQYCRRVAGTRAAMLVKDVELGNSVELGKNIEPANNEEPCNKEEKEEEIDETPSAPKRVRFEPKVARQTTLDKLEGVTRTNQRHAPRPRSLNSTAKPSETPKRLHTSMRFWLLSLGIGVGQASWYIILLFMTSISVSVGLDVHNAAIVLGAINGASAVGQFIAGYAADTIGPVNSLVVFTFVATVSNCILFVPNLSFHVLLAYACVCGASIGAADPLAVIAGVTQFGRARAAKTTGLVYASVGVLVAIAAPVARVIQHKVGSGGFTSVYVFVIALFSLSTVLLVLLRLRISRKLAFRV